MVKLSSAPAPWLLLPVLKYRRRRAVVGGTQMVVPRFYFAA
jgi:hypothetical protein